MPDRRQARIFLSARERWLLVVAAHRPVDSWRLRGRSILMTVYLVPASRDRYELYCEVAAMPVPDSEARSSTLRGRVVAVFRKALAEGEAVRRGVSPAAQSATSRVRRAVVRKIAEAVAEQRLLWHLRREPTAHLLHPDDLAPASAFEIMRRLLATDRDKHRRWCVIDALLTIASTPVALLPGPNVLAYYFIFRTVGHFLSMRGAQHGLSGVTWTAAGSEHLTAIRGVLPLEKDSRARRVDEIAAALGLDELGLFVENVADRP